MTNREAIEIIKRIRTELMSCVIFNDGENTALDMAESALAQPIDNNVCFHCGGKVCWDNDFYFEDFGYEGKGLVHICHCIKCGSEIEYRVSFDGQEGEVNEC